MTKEDLTLMATTLALMCSSMWKEVCGRDTRHIEACVRTTDGLLAMIAAGSAEDRKALVEEASRQLNIGLMGVGRN